MTDWDQLAGNLVLTNRLKAGLSQRAASERSGVTQAEICHIERGEKQPSLPTLGRILDALNIEIGLTSRLLDHRFSAAEIAEVVAQDAEVSEERAFRDCMTLLDDLRSVTPLRLKELVAVEPTLTGDSRFDALIASIVDEACLQAKVDPPVWVDELRRITEDWLVSGVEALREAALEQSPDTFARHGVYVLADELSRA
jgi:transcriptional regulator with XRE-family HTH domain